MGVGFAVPTFIDKSVGADVELGVDDAVLGELNGMGLSEMELGETNPSGVGGTEVGPPEVEGGLFETLAAGGLETGRLTIGGEIGGILGAAATVGSCEGGGPLWITGARWWWRPASRS